MTKKQKPKRIADAPTAPPLHQPIANAAEELFAYYRDTIAKYRKQYPGRKLVKDNMALLAHLQENPKDRELSVDEKQIIREMLSNDIPDSKISELERALDYADHAQKTLSALHCTELEPDELGELLDAADRLALCMHEVGRIAGEIGITETSQPDPHKKRNELIAATMEEAKRVRPLHPNANQCAAGLVDFATEEAKNIGFHDFYLSNRTRDEQGNKVPVSEINRQRTINKWLVEACIY